MWKGGFLLLAMEEKRKNRIALLRKVKHPLQPKHALVFLKWENILPGQDDEVPEQRLAFSVLKRYVDTDEKQTTSTHHGI